MISPDNRIVTVFGGGGFIGRYVCELLFARDVRVRVATRNPRTAHAVQPLGRVGQIHAVQANVRHPGSVEAAVSELQKIQHPEVRVNVIHTGVGGISENDVMLAAASSGAIFRPGEWYANLSKPPWTPPNWAFPVTWSVLFVLNAVAGWLVWMAAGADAVWPRSRCPLRRRTHLERDALVTDVRRQPAEVDRPVVAHVVEDRRGRRVVRGAHDLTQRRRRDRTARPGTPSGTPAASSTRSPRPVEH